MQNFRFVLGWVLFFCTFFCAVLSFFYAPASWGSQVKRNCERAKRALRASLRCETATTEADNNQAFIGEHCVGVADRYELLSIFAGERAKRTSANSRRESHVGEAGGHQPVWVRASFIVILKWVSEVSEVGEWVKWVITFWVLYFYEIFLW